MGVFLEALALSLMLSGPLSVFAGSNTYRNCDYRDFITEYEKVNLTVIDSNVLGENTVFKLDCKGRLQWTLILLDDIDEDVRYEVEVWKDVGNSWEYFLQQNKSFCASLSHPDGWACLLGFAYATPEELGPCCPVSKGKYTLKEYKPDPRDFPEQKPGHRFKLRYRWSAGGKYIAEVNMKMVLTDKFCSGSSGGKSFIERGRG